MDFDVKSDAVIEMGGDVFFSSLEYNALFRKNKDEEYADFQGCFYSERVRSCPIHIKVFCADGKLYFIPWEDGIISTYSLHDSKIEYIKKSDDGPFLHGFCEAVSAGDNYVLIPRYLSEDFMLLSLKDSKMNSIDLINKQLEKIPIDRNKYSIDCFGACVSNDGLIYTGLADSGLILSLSSDDYSMKLIDVKGVRIGNILEKDGCIWICEYSGCRLVKYELESKKISEYVLNDNSNTERPFYRFIEVNDDLYLLPCQTTTIWKYDRQMDKWDIFIDTAEVEGFERDRPLPLTLFFNYSIDGNVLELFAKAGNGTLRINMETKETEVVPVRVSQDTWEMVNAAGKKLDFDVVNSSLEKNGPILWEGLFNIMLPDMLNYLLDDKSTLEQG